MICSWNTGKKSFVEKQKGEIDCPSAGLENNNNTLESKFPGRPIIYGACIWPALHRTQHAHSDQDKQSKNSTANRRQRAFKKP